MQQNSRQEWSAHPTTLKVEFNAYVTMSLSTKMNWEQSVVDCHIVIVTFGYVGHRMSSSHEMKAQRDLQTHSITVPSDILSIKVSSLLIYLP